MSETTELTWNTDALKNEVKPYITGACTELIFASASISSLPTPKGCENAKNLYETVDKIKTKVSEIEADVQDAADGLEQNEKNIEDFLEGMWNGFKDLFNIPQGNKDKGTNNDEEKLKDPLSENNLFENVPNKPQIPESVLIGAAAVGDRKTIEEIAKLYGVETTEEKTIKKSRI